MNKVLSLSLMTLSLITFGSKKDSTTTNMTTVLRIAKAIHTVNPKLSEKKYMEYALGVYRASVRFEIEPVLLISIAQQETNFREGLPEGAAGEYGICQIRKRWLTDSSFIKEFGTQTVADLENPAKNFLYAAWILKDIRKVAKKGALPYWAYYNSVKFNNRLKYYLGVSRYLNQIRIAKAHVALGNFPERGIATDSYKNSCAKVITRKVKYAFPSVVVPRLTATNLILKGHPVTKANLYAYESAISILP